MGNDSLDLFEFLERNFELQSLELDKVFFISSSLWY